MQYRELGLSGIKASVVGIGTWQMGGWRWGGTEEKSSINTLHAALDTGINLVDTAPAYGRGLSEEIVGKAIKDRRDKVILATKCGLIWHADQGTFFFEQAGGPINKYLGPESIKYEIEQSLNRLQTDYIDLYQTHWQDPTTPIEATMEILLQLKTQGKIRAIGVSNANTAQMAEYKKYGLIASDQELYSMFDRQIEAENLPYCAANHISVISYAPLAKGLLSGKIGPGRIFSGDDQRAGHPRFTVGNLQRVQDLLKKFLPLTETHNINLNQLAIAWNYSQPGVTHVLAGTQKPEQAIDNAGAGDIELSPMELAFINQALVDFSWE
ncbi:MAG: aldo/keto reductase [Methanomassiliicoccales archaeon]